MNVSHASSRDRFALGSGATPSEAVYPAPVIPDHELLRRIGAGSYGEIWLARTVMGSFRAAKIVYRAAFDHDRPFEREFQGLKRFEPISHAQESQVHIFHVGRNDVGGFFYYVMELADPAEPQPGTAGANRGNSVGAALEGSCALAVNPQTYVPRTLKHELRTRGALPAAECVHIALGLSNALEHLHRHDLVHRDVKPSNIIFVGGRPKLADIGLVSSIDATRSLVGTDGYIAPEGPGTARADLYSLGKVLYECATGKDRLEFPKLPSGWRSDPEFRLLLELNEIVIKACEFEPSRRYQSAQEMSADLTTIRDGKSLIQKRTSGKRWKVLKQAAGVALTAGVLGVAGILVHQRPDQHRSSNAKAQKLYQQAAYQLNSQNFERTTEACTNLLEAVRLDPNFIGGYFKLFDVYSDDWSDLLPPQYNGLANLEWLAGKIHAMRPDSAEYRTVNAYIAYSHWDFKTALDEARRACQLDPQLLRSHILYGWLLLVLRGDAAAARREFEAAEGIDGSDITTQVMLGRTYYFERNFTAAIERYLAASRLESRSSSPHFFLGWAYEATQQFHQALDDGEVYLLAVHGTPTETRNKYQRARTALDSQGVRAMWQSLLEDEKHSPSPDLYEMARLCARLGDTDQVFTLLDRARETHTGHMEFLLFDDCWDSLRDEPRFDRQLELMHLPKIRPQAK